MCVVVVLPTLPTPALDIRSTVLALTPPCPWTKIPSHCTCKEPTTDVDGSRHITIPHTMPVLIIVVIAHIVLENHLLAVPTSIPEICLSVATVLLFKIALTSLHMLSMLVGVAAALL